MSPSSTSLQESLTVCQLRVDRRQQLIFVTALTILACMFYALLVLQAGAVSLAVLVQWLIVAATIWNPMFGVIAVFGLMGMFEAGGPDPLMGFGGYLHGSLSSNFSLSGLATTPIEIFLCALAAAVIAHGLLKQQLVWRRGAFDLPAIGFAVCIVLGLVRGLSDRGDLQIALWEARSLAYIPLAYFIAVNAVRSRADVRMLTRFALVGTTLYGLEGTWRKFALIDTNQLGAIPDFNYAHESVIFIIVAIMIVAAQAAFGASRLERWLGPVAVSLCMFTLVAAERRAGFIALGIAFACFSLVLLHSHRRAFVFIALPTMLAAAIYLPLFWNASGPVGQPARAVRSLIAPDARDAASNEYRDMEKVNVRATLKANPLLGVGFGKEFYFVVSLPDLSWWPFWHYEPHHNVMWVWLKVGAHGFVVFLLLLGSAIARASNLTARAQHPECRVFALLTLSGIVATLVFSYVDLGLVMGRVTIWLGLAMGVLAVLHELDASEQVGRGA